uniref:SPBC16G5.17 protein n=1 Tax=Fopius arisanus TaxID=64838 RepID=A0A0C9R8A2_9HYME
MACVIFLFTNLGDTPKVKPQITTVETLHNHKILLAPQEADAGNINNNEQPSSNGTTANYSVSDITFIQSINRVEPEVSTNLISQSADSTEKYDLLAEIVLIGNHEILLEMVDECSNSTVIPLDLKNVTAISEQNAGIIHKPSNFVEHDHTEVEDKLETDQEKLVDSSKINSTTSVEINNNQSLIGQTLLGDSSHEKENKICDSNEVDHFSEAFTLPVEYLPKKKKTKIEASGKPKLPSAGTSDEWFNYHVEKEKRQKIKEEKIKK